MSSTGVSSVTSSVTSSVRRSRVFERLDGHRGRTAQALGIGENTLWRKLKRYGMVRSRK